MIGGAAGGVGLRFGRYRTTRLLGKGGEGAVYLAHDVELDREVALKILPLPPGPDAEARLSGLRSEARLLARVEHPGVSVVYDVGATDGWAWLAMRHVDGYPLAAGIADIRAQGRALTAEEVRSTVEAVAAAADALQAAHDSGVVHGDVHPGNLILEPGGGCVVIDFGLAVAVDDTIDTISVRGVGNLAYVAPERIDGVGGVGCDVYGLAASLFEGVTLRPPHLEGTRERLVRAVLTEEVERADHIATAVPRDLGVVIAKALAPRPFDRYATARAFAEDLRRWLDGVPVRARPLDPVTAAWRYAGRHRAVAALALFLVVALVVWTWFVTDNNRERERLLAERRDATRAAVVSRDRARQDLQAYERLADGQRAEDLASTLDRLVPPSGDLVPKLRAWQASAEELVSRLPVHRRTLEELRRSLRRPVASERPRPRDDDWRWRDLELRIAATRAMVDALVEDGGVGAQRRAAVLRDQILGWQAELARLIASRPPETGDGGDPETVWKAVTLEHAIAEVEELMGEDGLLEEAGRRMALSMALDGGTDLTDEWRAAIRSIADRSLCPAYAGLRIEPQLGLRPLRRNPKTGLWEFLHVLSGAPPTVDEGGEFRVDGETGIVLVLLPGGVARMGARLPDADHEEGDPYVDRDAVHSEIPVHDVRLDPYFISKFEMTRGQWRRVRGRDGDTPIHISGDVDVFPVGSVTHVECVRFLRGVGLVLPTEAQWEAAARGGTTTRWWTGDDAASLEGAGNFKDEETGWEDGWEYRAPVGRFRPNPFGLHDTAGNLWEWCLERQLSYYAPTWAGTGERESPRESLEYVRRGGSYRQGALSSRSCKRNSEVPTARVSSTGVRPARLLDLGSGDASGR